MCFNILYKGFYMGANVLLNLLNELGERGNGFKKKQ